MFVDLKESTIGFARQFERLPEQVQEQLKASVAALVGEPIVETPDIAFWAKTAENQTRYIELIVKGYVNAN